MLIPKARKASNAHMKKVSTIFAFFYTYTVFKKNMFTVIVGLFSNFEAKPTQKERKRKTSYANVSWCAAHVCTLFSSTANLRESYGSEINIME
jgi:hypothetical protein